MTQLIFLQNLSSRIQIDVHIDLGCISFILAFENQIFIAFIHLSVFTSHERLWITKAFRWVAAEAIRVLFAYENVFLGILKIQHLLVDPVYQLLECFEVSGHNHDVLIKLSDFALKVVHCFIHMFS